MLSGGTSLRTLIGNGSSGLIGAISQYILPTLFTFALLAFVAGVVYYFFIKGGDAVARAKGRWFILWGVIGLAVLYGAWSIVHILLSTLGIAPAG